MSYGTTGGLTTYLALTGRTLTAGADPVVAIFRGAQYIDGTYWDRFYGTPQSDDIYFPIVDETTVPQGVEYATYEAAIIWAADNDALSFSSSAGAVKSEKVDVIKIDYFENKTEENPLLVGVPKFSVIEGLLSPYISKASQYGIAAILVQ